MAFALANDWGIRLGFLRYFSLIPPASPIDEASPLGKGGFKSGTVKTVPYIRAVEDASPYGCAENQDFAFKGPLPKGAGTEGDWGIRVRITHNLNRS